MSTDQQAGPGPSYERRALSTRGYIVAGVVPVLIAAGLFGLVAWNYDGSDIQGEAAPLLVLSWKPGQEAGSDPIAGVLEQDDAGCPVLTTAGESLAVVWPAGYSARVSPGGTLTVFDPADEAVVRADQELRATGTVAAAGDLPIAGKPCAPTDGQVAEIQSEVQVVG
jgi:hypothetical protein